MKPTSFFKLVSTLAWAVAAIVLPNEQAQAQNTPAKWLENHSDPLTWEGDIASRLVSDVDEFLLEQIDQTRSLRRSHWTKGMIGDDASNRAWLENAREVLKVVLGIKKSAPIDVQIYPWVTAESNAVILEDDLLRARVVRWPVLEGMHGEGLLIEPVSGAVTGTVIVSPDTEQNPEDWLGLGDGVSRESWWVRRYVQAGARVVIPDWISRAVQRRQSPSGGWGADLTHREYLYRPAFEMGRTVIGYETQKLLALVEWAKKAGDNNHPVGLVGYGEGGYLAMMAAALEPRLDAVWISGVFGPRESQWHEPLDRNLFGFLKSFSSAELIAMADNSKVVVEFSQFPAVHLAPGRGGAPADLTTPSWSSIQEEWDYLDALRHAIEEERPEAVGNLVGVSSGAEGSGGFGSKSAGQIFGNALFGSEFTVAESESCLKYESPLSDSFELPEIITSREARQIHEIDQYTQRLLVESPYRRQDFMKQIKTDSLENFEASSEAYRDYFKTETIGWFGDPDQPFNPRLRKTYETEKLIGYEVVLDVWEDVFAYGILMIPKDLKMSEKRPVVVCQHGLEGRPQDVADPNSDHYAYHRYAAALTEKGYITFSPQNIYIFEDRFRTLQRKANSIGRTLFSIITPQHQQIVDWLQTMPFVDPERVAFYGLSYGGKTAMRVPAIVTDYCLSICSADFNDWVWKNTSTRSPYSYVWSGEYEIFEFDLGETFNYAEMATLIAPRPFMVERGHFDGVAPDETVAYEFAKVRRLYQAQLGIGDRVELEWFVGPHTIHGVGTFEFLDKALNFSGK